MADETGCQAHYDSPLWSHLMMTLKLFLTWLGLPRSDGVAEGKLDSAPLDTLVVELDA